MVWCDTWVFPGWYVGVSWGVVVDCMVCLQVLVLCGVDII